mmetsp:Transcript_47510/g.90704  ORF Transcript_47510/g.90704 Transcript_47510/m.90704 type:complete len:225 (-) Transcript_47510:165-839(-)|eukprot:CAMPEP_0114261692 /NCGR_PEP_ID=MMETSP0058-20121206/21300_1 /TAXON_ID=36894 /ORGANISM="Pyramimonas parkeae, CCMP726" /LENGTH=224 /DNA_ID=CAMNT_0001377299 /DNA_START=141 /DNA_END=815 /DNA_ORIENTATION=+
MTVDRSFRTNFLLVVVVTWASKGCAYTWTVCQDSCAFANNGLCDSRDLCDYGTDCTDCGPMECNDSCLLNNDGYCQHSVEFNDPDTTCAEGTDGTDCKACFPGAWENGTIDNSESGFCSRCQFSKGKNCWEYERTDIFNALFHLKRGDRYGNFCCEKRRSECSKLNWLIIILVILAIALVIVACITACCALDERCPWYIALCGPPEDYDDVTEMTGDEFQDEAK